MQPIQVSEALIKKSFLCCGQSISSTPENVTCLREGQYAHAILEQVKQIWNQSEEQVANFQEPTHIADDSQEAINEPVEEETQEGHEEDDVDLPLRE